MPSVLKSSVRASLKCPVPASLKCPLWSSGRKAGQGSQDPIQREGRATDRRPRGRCRAWRRGVGDAANLASVRQGFQRSGLRPTAAALSAAGELCPPHLPRFFGGMDRPRWKAGAVASRNSRVLAWGPSGKPPSHFAAPPRAAWTGSVVPLTPRSPRLLDHPPSAHRTGHLRLAQKQTFKTCSNTVLKSSTAYGICNSAVKNDAGFRHTWIPLSDFESFVTDTTQMRPSFCGQLLHATVK